MGEWKRAGIGAIVGAIVMGTGAWAVHGNELSSSALVRMAVLEKMAESNTIAVAGLTAHVETLAQGQIQITTNAKNIGELTAEVREILKAVIRLEAISEKR